MRIQPATLCTQVRAQGALVTAGDLHLVSLLTPTSQQGSSACGFGDNERSWRQLQALWERLDGVERGAATKMGVDAYLLTGRSGGWIGAGQSKHVCIEPYHQLWRALLLRRLSSDGACLEAVAKDFGCQLGDVQRLQTDALTCACQVRTFCEEMNWSALTSLVRGYQERLDFGGSSADLKPLLRLKHVQLGRAKALYRAGYRTVDALALAPPHEVARVLQLSSGGDGSRPVVASEANAAALLLRQAEGIVAAAAWQLRQEG